MGDTGVGDVNQSSPVTRTREREDLHVRGTACVVVTHNLRSEAPKVSPHKERPSKAGYALDRRGEHTDDADSHTFPSGDIVLENYSSRRRLDFPPGW